MLSWRTPNCSCPVHIYIIHIPLTGLDNFHDSLTTDIIKQRRVMLFPWLNFPCSIKWILFNCMFWLEDTPSRMVIITTWIYVQICSAGNKSFLGLCNVILVCVHHTLHKNRKNSQILRHWYKSLLKHCCRFFFKPPFCSIIWGLFMPGLSFGKSNSLLHKGESLKAL